MPFMAFPNSAGIGLLQTGAADGTTPLRRVSYFERSRNTAIPGISSDYFFDSFLAFFSSRFSLSVFCDFFFSSFFIS